MPRAIFIWLKSHMYKKYLKSQAFSSEKLRECQMIYKMAFGWISMTYTNF